MGEGTSGLGGGGSRAAPGSDATADAVAAALLRWTAAVASAVAERLVAAAATDGTAATATAAATRTDHGGLGQEVVPAPGLATTPPPRSIAPGDEASDGQASGETADEADDTAATAPEDLREDGTIPTRKEIEEGRRRAAAVSAAIEEYDATGTRTARSAVKARHAAAFDGMSPSRFGAMMATYRAKGERGLRPRNASRLPKAVEGMVAEAIAKFAASRSRSDRERLVARRAVHDEVARRCAATGARAPTTATIGQRIDEHHDRKARGGRYRTPPPEGQPEMPLARPAEEPATPAAGMPPAPATDHTNDATKEAA